MKRLDLFPGGTRGCVVPIGDFENPISPVPLVLANSFLYF